MAAPTAQPIPETTADDPRCVPVKLHGAIPIGDEIAYPDYSDDQNAVWRDLFGRQVALLPGRAADEFLTGLSALELDHDGIPALRDVSRKLDAATGWKLARTPGLLDAHDFFAHLA